MTEEELLAELELDGRYSDVRSALLAYKQLEGDYTREHQVTERLEQTAKRLGLPADDLLKSLAELDPRGQATKGGPSFGNFERFLAENTETQFHDFYRSMAGALSEDMKTQIMGGFGRLLQSLESGIDDVRLDMQIDKFLRVADKAGNLVNQDWIGREGELKKALEINPQWRDNPNRIDLARRFVMAGKEPKKEASRVNEKAKQLVQGLREKQRARFAETPGRALPRRSGDKKGPDGFTDKEREAFLDDADRRGLRLA